MQTFASSSKTLSASGLVKTGPGVVRRIVVGTSSSLTLKLWDNTSGAGTVLLDTTAAITAPMVIEIGAAFSTGLYVTIGGSGTFAVIYN